MILLVLSGCGNPIVVEEEEIVPVEKSPPMPQPICEVCQQEISPAGYHNLALDALMFPDIKPLVESAMEDYKVTLEEIEEIYSSQEWTFSRYQFFKLQNQVLRVERVCNAQKEAKAELVEMLKELD
jgi:hypothetical protein